MEYNNIVFILSVLCVVKSDSVKLVCEEMDDAKSLSAAVSAIQVEIEDIKLEIEAIRDYNCNGFRRHDVCYWALFKDEKVMTYQEAKWACGLQSGKPADIIDADHYNRTIDYVRTLFSSGNKGLWLGMTYSYEDGRAHFSDGTEALNVQYYPGYPVSNSAQTQMALFVDYDTDKTDQGIWNERHAYKNNGVLCQK